MPEIWSYCPTPDQRKETFEWNTEVISFYRGEQRIAQRVNSQYKAQISCELYRSELGEAKMIARKIWREGELLFPVWSERVFIENLPITGYTDRFTGDFSNSFFPRRTKAMLWFSNSEYHEVEVFSSTDSEVVIVPETLPDYSDRHTAVLVPLLHGAFDGAVTFKAKNIMRPTAEVKFIAFKGRFPGNTSPVDSEGTLRPSLERNEIYAGHFVVPTDHITIKGAKETAIRANHMFETQQGMVHFEPEEDYLTDTFMADFALSNMRDKNTLLALVHYMRGQQKVFWLPSMNYDLRMMSDQSSVQRDRITIKWTRDPETLLGNHVCIFLRNGKRFFAEIVDLYLPTVPDTVGIILSSEMPTALRVDQVAQIGFMSLFRSESDLIEFSYPDIYGCEVSIPCRRTRDYGV